MPTPSGAITMQDIQDEFGGSHPISLSEYYGVASGVPSSGAISMGDLRNKSAATIITEGSNGANGNGAWGYNSDAGYGSVSGTVEGETILAFAYSEFTVKSSQSQSFGLTLDGIHTQNSVFTSITLGDTAGDPVLTAASASFSTADGKSTWTWSVGTDYSSDWDGSGTQELTIA